MIVLDVGGKKMEPVDVYTAGEVPGTGCGLLPLPLADGGVRMYTNAGSKATGDAENVYVWDATRIGERPLPQIIPLTVSDRGDVHGPQYAGNVGANLGRYLWVAMRLDNTINVIDTRINEEVNTFSLANDDFPNPTLDVIDFSLTGNHMYVALRGFCPLTAIPEFVDETSQTCPFGGTKIASPGRTPGVGVINVQQGGLSGTLKSVQPITNVDGSGFDSADPHGLKTLFTGTVPPGLAAFITEAPTEAP
jgi:hypothetical protein